jgi:hypothetical protein
LELITDSENAKPRYLRAGSANPPGVERGDQPMILSVLFLLLILFRKRRTKLKIDIDL